MFSLFFLYKMHSKGKLSIKERKKRENMLHMRTVTHAPIKVTLCILCCILYIYYVYIMLYIMRTVTHALLPASACRELLLLGEAHFKAEIGPQNGPQN